MVATATSPNTGNYVVGKGIVVFKRDGDTAFRHVGNVAELEFEPTLETLEHFSSMAGIRSKDQTIVLETGGTVRLLMDEWTPANLALFLLGSVNLAAVGGPEVTIMSTNVIGGELRYYGNNDVGPRWNFFWNRVEFSPSGSINPISDEYGQIEVTGEIAQSAGAFGLAKLTNLGGATVPLNVLPPAITWTGDQVAPESGQTVSTDGGVWVGNPTSFAYQWQADGVDIVGATASSFLLTVTQEGAAITVEVIATNSIGASAEVESAPTPDVVAP